MAVAHQSPLTQRGRERDAERYGGERKVNGGSEEGVLDSGDGREIEKGVGWKRKKGEKGEEEERE